MSCALLQTAAIQGKIIINSSDPILRSMFDVTNIRRVNSLLREMILSVGVEWQGFARNLIIHSKASRSFTEKSADFKSSNQNGQFCFNTFKKTFQENAVKMIALLSLKLVKWKIRWSSAIKDHAMTPVSTRTTMIGWRPHRFLQYSFHACSLIRKFRSNLTVTGEKSTVCG